MNSRCRGCFAWRTRRRQRDGAAGGDEIVDALGALPVPALDQHRADSPSPASRLPWLSIAASSAATGSSSSAAASGRLGVISDASGMSFGAQGVDGLRREQAIA